MKDLKENDIVVSILCNTYNHENYISDAIESFLMQKTNFKYEILIHDDASTDKTAEIIREYEMRYSDIIKPIYQKENQHSKGVRVALINHERANGKYYALCEGDDYWSNPNKLKKQVDYLEKNPDCSACVHASLNVNAEGNKTIFKIRPSRCNKELSIQEVIKGGGAFVATNSIVYRRDMGSIRPEFYYKNKFSFGDYQLIILLTLVGKVYYLDEVMSVYRSNVPESWTSRNLLDTEKASNHFKEVNSMLDVVNIYTKYAYDDIIQETKQKNELGILIRQGKLREAKLGTHRNYYNNLNLINKISINLKHYSPNLHNKLVLIIKKILNG